MGVLAFDIGGSAVKFGIWENEKLGDVSQFKTPLSWEEMQQKLIEIAESFQKSGRVIEGIAISAPGVVDKERGQINGISAVPYIHKIPVFKMLTKTFQLPVSIENDANCAALAELWKGAAKDCQNVLFVVIGTGIGGAVIIDGKLQTGAHLYGGEFGLMVLDNDQSFSTLGTAVNMAKRYSLSKGKPEDFYSGEEVFRLADTGDTVAKEHVSDLYHYLALGIYNLQYTFDPEKIILGGGVSSKEDLISEINKRLQIRLEKNQLKDFFPVIVPCEYKNNANLIGAVANFMNERALVQSFLN
ncbi:N-acetylmannosamine kinase [Bacillus cereus]|nr:N-acetylmannosamine kinase [Bacillus cereus]PGU65978.1 N-acetylmannosamine kinase [Bacillus cereus]